MAIGETKKVGGYPSVEMTIRVSEGGSQLLRNLLSVLNTIGHWGSSRGIGTEMETTSWT